MLSQRRASFTIEPSLGNQLDCSTSFHCKLRDGRVQRTAYLRDGIADLPRIAGHISKFRSIFAKPYCHLRKLFALRLRLIQNEAAPARIFSDELGKWNSLVPALHAHHRRLLQMRRMLREPRGLISQFVSSLFLLCCAKNPQAVRWTCDGNFRFGSQLLLEPKPAGSTVVFGTTITTASLEMRRVFFQPQRFLTQYLRRRGVLGSSENPLSICCVFRHQVRHRPSIMLSA